MIQYPKISYYNTELLGNNIIAWDKLDGNNFRATFSKNKGFYKFGTKTEMINSNHDIYGKIIPLFLEKYSESLSKIFIDKYKNILNFTIFGEYVGKNSFAGIHDINDNMDIVLFDVILYKYGFIDTWEFLDNFGHLSIPSIIYKGEYTEQLIESIKINIFNLKEGVIIKGFTKTKKYGKLIFMNKVKTNFWLNTVKEKYGMNYLLEEFNGDIKLFDEWK